MEDNDANLSDGPLSAGMSANAFALWGVDDIAYVKQIDLNGQTAWAIFSADGSALGATEDRDLAFATVLQADRSPVSVH